MDPTINQTSPQSQPQQPAASQPTPVPYTPQLPQIPNNQKQSYYRAAMNGLMIAVVLLLGGFMTYNFVGNQLTKLAGQSVEKTVTPTPTILLTPTPTIYLEK